MGSILPENQTDLGGEDAALAMDEAGFRIADLPLAGLAGHLPVYLVHMREPASNAGMAKRHQPAVGVGRQLAVRSEVAFAAHLRRTATRSEAEILKESEQRDRVAVIDAGDLEVVAPD